MATVINVLPYTESERVIILKAYGRTAETVKDDIENIKEWMAKQPHLPEVADENVIERLLLINKFRVEVTKKKLDMYYTVRNVFPELYDKDPSSQQMKNIRNVVHYVTLPKLTKELYRVTVVKLKDPNPDNFDPVMFAALTFSVVDVRLYEDYSMSEVQIFDFSDITLGHLLKFNPFFVRKCGLVVQRVLSNRISAIHFINAPAFTESFLYLLKAVLNPKVLERVHVHRDSESLEKLVPLEILPKDLGGKEKSLDELSEQWGKKLLQYEKPLQRLRSLKVNEALRPEKFAVDELYGVEGTFRKLELD